MSALKHGLFRAGFMLCDRCVFNGVCKHFEPRGQCVLERKAFDDVVSRLMEEFELESLADKIMVERVAMYLIRIARAEAYEAAVGVGDKSPLWGEYISRLDNMLRAFLNDLAVTRLQRKKLEKEEALLVSVDEVFKKFSKSEVWQKRRAEARAEIMDLSVKRIMLSWKREFNKLIAALREGKSVG